MPKINGKIYYNNVTGNTLLVVNQNEGVWIRETTFAEDVATYPQLKEVNEEVIGVVNLKWDQYKDDILSMNGVRFNLETKELEFSYPVPGAPAEEPVYQRPLTEQIAEVRAESESLNMAIIELYELTLGGM